MCNSWMRRFIAPSRHKQAVEHIHLLCMFICLSACLSGSLAVSLMICLSVCAVLVLSLSPCPFSSILSPSVSDDAATHSPCHETHNVLQLCKISTLHAQHASENLRSQKAYSWTGSIFIYIFRGVNLNAQLVGDSHLLYI